MTQSAAKNNYTFDLHSTDGAARAGNIKTAHGDFLTPAFMPVGTAGSVKALSTDDIISTGTQILLANTYHLLLRPGAERLGRLGGLHNFMNWNGPILTDSGGFQVLSLAELREVEESGVKFKSHLDGSKLELTPEIAMHTQHLIGSDISMILDVCCAYPVSIAEAESAMHLSLRWAKRCKSVFEKRPGYALFGIVQGGIYAKLRKESVEGLKDIGFDGYAIGGLAVGEEPKIMLEVLEATLPRLPVNRPRYLMGVGKPDQIVDAVIRGVDMFDCVLPTRSGRTGQAFTRNGPINIRNSQFKEDSQPIDPQCGCRSCIKYSRAYVHHLVKAREILGVMILTNHNVTFYQDIISDLREAIIVGKSESWRSSFMSQYYSGLNG